MKQRLLPTILLLTACGATEPSRRAQERPRREAPEPPAPTARPEEAPSRSPDRATGTARPAQAAVAELGFDPSPEDRPHAGVTGFLGTRKVTLDDGSEAVGPVVAGVKPGSGAEAAGLKERDVIVGLDGAILRPALADPIGAFRERLLTHAPDTDADFQVWREKEGVRTLRVRLGRAPPAFARMETPAEWLAGGRGDPNVVREISAALAIDGGEARYEDTLARNRKHSSLRDSFRLREVTEAHVDLAAHEAIARRIARAISSESSDEASSATVAAGLSLDPADPPWGGAGRHLRPSSDLPPDSTLDQTVDWIAARIVEADSAIRRATASWSTDERTFVGENWAKLTERTLAGEYLYDDEDPARERTNRRLVALLARVDRAAIVESAEIARAVVRSATERLVALAAADGREGLLAARDTPAGRVEIWGRGNQRHANRCAFLFDLSGNDDYLDVAGRADPDRPVSVYVDASGDDLWAATSPFGLCGALAGVAVVTDLSGDDQYLSRDWSQAAAVAGFALLDDRSGRDVYHAQGLSQGVALAGAAVLADGEGADLYTGTRFCQGVGLPGGVGVLHDLAGDDRYVCTGRHDSEYGEPGLFSGWGQGVGFGFRQIASGGIGMLLDDAGDDVYEAGNFSQGGGYFYAWGILIDGAGRDRYVGSRYAQGFAAHQAVGTFLEDEGDDLYQSHSNVAQGLSWDETSVVFRDRVGNDRYETTGFSLASAAHNGLVLFVDDAGDDTYAGLPAHAKSNEYHGGWSFALFLDRAGRDVYAGADAAEWNGRSLARDEGAYHVDR